MHKLLLVVALVFVTPFGLTAHAQHALITAIDPTPNTDSTPYDINDAGQVVLQDFDGTYYFWSGGAAVPVASAQIARSLNENGEIGGSRGDFPAVWIAPNGPVLQPSSDCPTYHAGQAYGLSSTMAVGRGINGFTSAFYRSISSQCMNELPHPPAVQGGVHAFAINEDNVIVGDLREVNSNAPVAVRWLPPYSAIDAFGALGTTSLAINSQGDIVGQTTSGGVVAPSRPVLWPADGSAMVYLSDHQGDDVYDINNKGQAVGNYFFSAPLSSATMWQNGVAIDLNTYLEVDSGWSFLRDARAMNNRSQIVGVGTKDGHDIAFILTLLPGDLNGDDHVDVTDLFQLLSQWGACDAAPSTCPSDINGDGQVGVTDLFYLLSSWG